jgi:very-short-patch-repair endonuclease
MKANPIIFVAVCVERHIPQPVAEYRFHPSRKWRFDYAWTLQRVALEIEGGAFVGGRHTSGSGFIKDCEKYSEAAAMGWRILRIQPKELMTEYAFDLIRRALAFTP